MEDFFIEKIEDREYLCFENTNPDQTDLVIMGMLKENTIEGATDFFVQQIDDSEIYKYDISNMKSINNYYKGLIKKRDLINFLDCLRVFLDTCGSYLVEPEQVVIDGDYIFYDKSRAVFCFIVLPIRRSDYDFMAGLKELIVGFQPDGSENNSYYTDVIRFFEKNNAYSSAELTKLIYKISGRRHDISAIEPNHSFDIGKTDIPVKNEDKPSGTNNGDRQNKFGLFKKKSKSDEAVKNKPVTGSQEMPIPKRPDVSADTKAASKTVSTSFGGLNIPNSGTVQNPVMERKKTLRKDSSDSKDFGVKSLFKHRKKENQADSNAEPVDSEYSLLRLSTGEKFPLKNGINKIGRNRDAADIYITDNKYFGRVHAAIKITGNEIVIIDNASSNGSYINEKRIVDEVSYRFGDKIKFGNEEFVIV